MIKKLFFFNLLNLLFFAGNLYSQKEYLPAVESFESDKILSFYKKENTSLSLSEERYRFGKKSLKWSFTGKSSFETHNFKILTLDESPLAYGIFFPASPTFAMSIYNEKAIDDKLQVSFNKNGEKSVYFNVNLNFSGWRRIWVPFYEMFGDAPKKGEQVSYNSFKISANLAQGNLFFDDIIFSQYQDDRHQYPDELVPFIKRDKILSDDFWMPLLSNYKRIENLDIKPVSMATKMDLKKFENIIAQDLTVPSKYKTYINSLRENFNKLNITEKNGKVYGPPLTFYHQQEYFDENQQGKNNFNDVKELALTLRKLSHFHQRSTPEETKQIEEMFILGTKYFLDQGWQAGSNGGTRHHVGYFVRGIAEAFFTMRYLLYQKGLLNNVAESMHWVFNLGVVLGDEKDFEVNIDYLNTEAYYHLMIIFLFEKQEQQAALLQAFSNYISITLAQQKEEFGFKIDGTSWHHDGHYAAYAYGAFKRVPSIIKTLSKTRFKISPEGHNNFKKAFLNSSKFSQKYDWGFGNAGRHPLEDYSISSLKDQYLLMANSGNPAATENIDKETAAAYIRLFGDEDVLNTTLFTSINNIQKQKLPKYFTMPYAATAIQRKGEDWAAIIKGYSKYVWASEIYVDENRYGRYPSNGTIQLLNKKGEKGSGFQQEGWDWNLYPGATIIYLPLKELEPKRPLLTFRSNETFAGANQLNDNGVFSMILNEGSGLNADGVNDAVGFPGKLKAKKSVFSFDDKLICIGTNISSVDSKNRTQTNLFQNFLNDEKLAVFVNDKEVKKFPFKEEIQIDKTSNNSVIDAYGNGYYIVSKNKITVQKKNQKSYHNEYSVNTGKTHTGDKGVKETEGDYASAWLQHGLAPKNQSYQYIIYPFLDEAKKENFSKIAKIDNSYSILRADSIAHIVKDLKTNTTGYVVFEADTNLENGILKSVSKPALIMARKEDANKTILSVVQPDLNFPEYQKGKFRNYSQSVKFSICLDGKWSAIITENVLAVVVTANETIISLKLKDGLSKEIALIKQ